MSSELAIALPGQKISIEMDQWTAPFWEAAKNEQLTTAKCGGCGTFRMPPTPFCPECHSQEVSWPVLPGTGEVYSYTICRRSPYPDIPNFTYIPIIVGVDGAPGVRIISSAIGITPNDIEIGMKMTVDWHEINGGWKIPVFRKAEQASPGTNR